MDIALFWSLFVILGVTCFVIAIGSCGYVRTKEEFFFANKSISFIPLTLTLLATQMGGGFFLGSTDACYQNGIWGLSYGLGISGGFLLLSLLVAPRLRKLNINTTAQIFTIKSHSLRIRKLVSLLSIITLSGLLTGQIIASRKVFSYVSGGENIQWILILFWVLVIFYTVLGGIKAIVATDAFQFGVFSVVFLGIIAFLIVFTPQVDFLFLLQKPLLQPKSLSYYDGQKAFLLFLLPLCYSLFSQDMGQRFLSAKSAKVASFALFSSFLISLIFVFVPYFIAEFMRTSLLPQENTNIFLQFMEQNTDIFFYYLAICAIVAALSSTADSLLCAIGSNVIEDFFPKKKQSLEPQLGVFLARGVTFFIGVISLLMAYMVEDITKALMFSYELSVSSVFLPFCLCYFSRKKQTEKSLLGAIFGGLIGILLLKNFFVFLPPVLLSIFTSFICYLLVRLYESNKTPQNGEFEKS